MSKPIPRKYGIATTIPFSLVEVDGVDFRVDAVYAAGDVKITKDEGAEANTASGFVDEGSKYSIALSATEMQAERISLIFIDQTATKVWLDTTVEIETYGNASAQHAFDLDTASVAQTADNDAILSDPVFGNAALNDSLSQIANVGAAINVSVIPAPNGFTLTTGSEVNDEDDTIPLDGTRHELSDAAGTLDAIYKFDIGGDAAPVSVTFTGVYNGGNDDFIISANTGTDGTPVWVQIGTLEGTNSSSNVVRSFDMFTNMVVSDITGQVQVRINNTGLTSSSFDTDQVFVSKSSTSRSVGYALGRIWTNTLSGTAGSDPFFNGVGDKASLLWSDTLLLSTALTIKDFHIINGSTIQFTANSDNFSLFGNNWTLQLNNQSVANSYFEGANVSGICTASTEVHFEGCEVATMSVQLGHFDFCSFDGTVTMTLAGDYNYHNSYSKVAGVGGPTFTKTAGQTITAQWRNWAGSMTLSGIQAGDVFTISGEELGAIVLNGVDGTVKILGQYESLTDNRTGSPVLVEGAFQGSDVTDILSDTAEIGTAGVGLTQVSLISTGLDAIVSTATGMVEIAKAIWDRLLTGATHNIVNSAGRRVREVIDSVVLSSDTAQSATINTITLAAAEPSVDGTYDPATITIVSGKGFGQSRNALQYEGSTRILTVDRNWKDIPDGTSVYAVTSNAGREHVNEGLAQGGTSTTITLNTLASSNDTAYPGQMAFIRSGTGDDQAKLILTYNGTTKVATINGTWDPIPNATSGYVILPTSPVALSASTQATIDAIPTVTQILTTQMTESYAADGVAPTLAQAMHMIWSDLRSPQQVTTTWTDFKLDNTTVSMTFTLDDATTPTKKTRAT